MDKELGKIRKKYTSDRVLSGAMSTTSQVWPWHVRGLQAPDPPDRCQRGVDLAAYDKRKYMWKLLYTRMLGYDVEFGQRQAMDLIAANG